MSNLTNYPNGISSFGIPVVGNGLLPSQGNVYFVKPSSGNDANSGTSPNAAFKTLAKALSAARANQNDQILLYAESNSASGTTDYQSETLDWNKDMVHLIGVNAGAQIGQRSRIAQLSTVKTIENLVTFSANACLIANISVYQGVDSSTATSPIAVTVSGERNCFVNCTFSGIGNVSMDTAGARSAVISGSENTFDKCYFGLDTVIRATAAAEISFSGSPTRNIFNDCVFNTYTDDSNFLMFTVAATMDRFTKFKNCEFLCADNITSAVNPDAVFGGSISSINGVIHLNNPYTNFTQYAAADASRVIALGFDGTATGHLIGIAQGIDAA